MLNPGRIRIIAVGKVRKSWMREALQLYCKRLSGLTILELKDTDPRREALAITSELRRGEKLITLSEKGRRFGSVELAEHLRRSGSDRLVFVIGGADGLEASLRERADWELSLSDLTFPHELARLLLVEQLYRTQTILQGGPYHRA